MVHEESELREAIANAQREHPDEVHCSCVPLLKMRIKELEEEGMMKVLPCSCLHEYQDKCYGRQMRIHNQAPKKPDNNGGWTCTVCGKTKSK